MELYSTNNKEHKVSLKRAVLEGLSPDGGLYMPSRIPKLPPKFFEKIQDLSFQQIAFEVAKCLTQRAIPDQDLKEIVNDAINFDAPLVEFAPNTYSLELHHGPTLAFKDFGARFMSRLTSYFLQGTKQETTILVATSGDTGSAVASGFYKVPNINVVILYPSGKVSEIQEMQLTTMGANITTLEIEGVFDDCQALVKKAFVDSELKQSLNLSSANSINIARLIPQSFYYFHAYAQLKRKNPKTLAPIFSVPSGNFGNLTAGLFAQKMGLPVQKFIAATNANDTFPQYLHTGNYEAKPSKATISNAMDVGNPSNFARMKELFPTHEEMQTHIDSNSYSDEATKETMLKIQQTSNYTLEPHGAVAYLGLEEYRTNPETPGILLETAHPAKFKETTEQATQTTIEIPERLAECMQKEKKATVMPNNFEKFKHLLLSRSS